MDTRLLTRGIATRYDWTVEQNEKVVLQIPVVDSNGDPFSVDGWNVFARIEDDKGGKLLHSWSSGDTLASGTDAFLTILPDTSAAWDFFYGWWWCVVQHPTDPTQRHRIVQGSFQLSPE